MNFSALYLEEVILIAEVLEMNSEPIEKIASILADTRQQGGRLFILGVGGSAANASHAVNDFRKICNIEAYAATDNVAELTARINDDGWDSAFQDWLRGCHLSPQDTILILSVGGGDAEKGISVGLIKAIDLARSVRSRIIGIVGRKEGYTAIHADACVIVPAVSPERVTPHTESFQAVIWHLLVSHPKLKVAQTKWESL